MKTLSLLRRWAVLGRRFRKPVMRPDEKAQKAMPEPSPVHIDAAYVRALAAELVLDFEQLRGCDAVLIGVESHGCQTSPLKGEMIVRMYGMDWSRDLRIVFGALDRPDGLPTRSDPVLVNPRKEIGPRQPVRIQVASFDECWGVLCCVLTDLDVRSLILQFGEDYCSPLAACGP